MFLTLIKSEQVGQASPNNYSHFTTNNSHSSGNQSFIMNFSRNLFSLGLENVILDGTVPRAMDVTKSVREFRISWNIATEKFDYQNFEVKFSWRARWVIQLGCQVSEKIIQFTENESLFYFSENLYFWRKKRLCQQSVCFQWENDQKCEIIISLSYPWFWLDERENQTEREFQLDFELPFKNSRTETIWGPDQDWKKWEI